MLVRHGDEFTPILTTAAIQTDASDTWLRIRREGQNFTFLWRDSEKAKWQQAATYAAEYPPSILTGLIAINTADEFEINFAYIRLTPVKR